LSRKKLEAGTRVNQALVDKINGFLARAEKAEAEAMALREEVAVLTVMVKN